MAFFHECEKCSLSEYRKENNYKMVWGDGNPGAKIVLIGEAPGEAEAKEGKPFIGRSGKLLRKLLSVHLDLSKDVFITNTLLCRPEGNRNPDLEEQNKCYPFIYSQLFTIKPKIVLTAGKISSEWFSKVSGKYYKIYEGVVVDLKYFKTLWLPLYHPSYLLRKPSAKVGFEECLKKHSGIFKRIIAGEEDSVYAEVVLK